MEAKLKSLKVADLKEICTRANVPTTTRSTKADLITKILSSQSAIDAYKAKYKQDENPAPISRPPVLSNNDDIVILAPPEEVDWTLEDPLPSAPVPVRASKPPSTSVSTKTAPPPAKPQSNAPPPKATPNASEITKPSVPAPPTPVDEELEKRKARAARFGIALVEPPKPKIKSTPASAPASKTAKATVDPEKLKARAERFGIAKPEQTGTKTAPAASSKKRGAAVMEEVDLDEQERRRKRAERFGVPIAGARA